MVESIIEGLTDALSEAYPDATIDSDVKQDLEGPCFFVTVVDPSSKKALGNRYFRKYPLVIEYVPETENSQKELREVAENLYELTESVTSETYGDFTGSKMNYAIISGILHFLVEYDVYVTKETTETDAMESMDVAQDVKG